MTCKTCGGEMIQKSRARLLLVGVAMLAGVPIAYCTGRFWAVAVFLAMTGVYLVIWATAGRARWCRNCKKF